MSTTETLVKNILSTRYDDFPETLIEHAKKSIMNWMGVAIGASHHASVDMVLDLKKDLGGSDQVSVYGRSEKADIALASLINGMTAHIFDYDDTHLDTIHHPSSPVAPVAFALGEKLKLSGKEVLTAFILGCEAELRISNAVYPSHYDLGWHITSTTGSFGAAVAAGILLNLSEEQMKHALGLAGTQASGLRDVFGTMTKPFHPGKAAHNGLISALLAKKGFTCSTRILEAKRGFANVLAPQHQLEKVNADWKKVWELEKNSFKPYACGIVLHPVIDACIGLKEASGAGPDDVQEIEIHVNPYVLELTGIEEPKTGLAGKFSVYHTASIAFIDGDAGQDQYEDSKVLDPKTVAMHKKIKPVIKPSMREDEAYAKLVLKNGQVFETYIEHATGSRENPMTLEGLKRKFLNVTKHIISKDQASELIDVMMNIEKEVNLDNIVRMATLKN